MRPVRTILKPSVCRNMPYLKSNLGSRERGRIREYWKASKREADILDCMGMDPAATMRISGYTLNARRGLNEC